MTEAMRGSVEDLGLLVSSAIAVSKATGGREVTERRLEYGSNVFTVICLTADAILRLHPKSGFFTSVAGQDVWNPASIAALVRVLMEATVNLHYFVTDEVTNDERDFRFLLADLHLSTKRLVMVTCIRSERHRLRGRRAASEAESGDMPSLDDLRARVEAASVRLQDNVFYRNLSAPCRKKCLKARRPALYDREELFKRAGISLSNYQSDYERLSAYVHTAPFAVQQMAAFRADDEGAVHLLVEVPIRSCCGYLSLAITHYLRLFPEAAAVLPTDAAELVDWCRGYATEMLDDDEDQA